MATPINQLLAEVRAQRYEDDRSKRVCSRPGCVSTRVGALVMPGGIQHLCLHHFARAAYALGLTREEAGL